ncbi:551_t:CDS:1, partial [Gigaspora rosea]
NYGKPTIETKPSEEWSDEGYVSWVLERTTIHRRFYGLCLDYSFDKEIPSNEEMFPQRFCVN